MTTTTTAQSWSFTVTRNDREMRVVSPGGKAVVIDLTKIDEAKLTAAEQSVLAPMECEGEADRPFAYVLNVDECRLLASVRDKVAALTGKAAAQTTARAIHDGLARRTSGSGADAAEVRVDRLRRIVEATSDELVLLIYDIPTVKNAECPNPSGLLWHHGFRLNLSCWVLPKERLATPVVARLLDHWKEHQIRTHVIPQSPEQAEMYRAIARTNLAEELVRVHTSLIKSIDSADQALKAFEADLTKTARELEIADQVRFNKVRAIIRAAGESLNSAVECAELFDATDSVKDLLEGLRAAVASQTATFNAAAMVKGRRTV